jgi:hypothetical protein
MPPFHQLRLSVFVSPGVLVLFTVILAYEPKKTPSSSERTRAESTAMRFHLCLSHLSSRGSYRRSLHRSRFIAGGCQASSGLIPSASLDKSGRCFVLSGNYYTRNFCMPSRGGKGISWLSSQANNEPDNSFAPLVQVYSAQKERTNQRGQPDRSAKTDSLARSLSWRAPDDPASATQPPLPSAQWERRQPAHTRKGEKDPWRPFMSTPMSCAM